VKNKTVAYRLNPVLVFAQILAPMVQFQPCCATVLTHHYQYTYISALLSEIHIMMLFYNRLSQVPISKFLCIHLSLSWFSILTQENLQNRGVLMLFFRLVALLYFTARVTSSTIATFTDDQCKDSYRDIEGPNGCESR
jgi:hypothetical protein